MQTAFLFLTLFAVHAMAAEIESVAKESVQEFEKDAKNRPVSKVIALLKDMVKQLEKEGEDDEEIYETMGCWCVTNDKAKTKSIADAETEIETLTATIETLTATSSKLNTQIANLNDEIKKNEEALATATSVREKELAEFTQEEKDSLVSINQLKAAVVALSAAHDASLLKKKSKIGTVDAHTLEAAEQPRKLDPDFVKSIEAEAIRAHMHRIITTHPTEFISAFLQVNHKALSVPQRHEIVSFLQGPSSSMFAKKIREYAMRMKDDRDEQESDKFTHVKPFQGLKLPAPIQSLLTKVLKRIDTGKDVESLTVDTGLLDMSDSDMTKMQYEPASGAIFGVLKQMKENMEINLEQSQQAEAKASDEYDQLKAAKEEEIKTSTDLVNTKTDELAATDEKNAQSKEIKEDTEASLASDQAFLADLKERCASMDQEFEERTKGRQLEITAVSKALAFLNSDEAHDLFTRTFNPVFLQVQKKQAMRNTAAFKILRGSALRNKNVNMLQLADKLRKGGDNAAFKKVREEVTEMIDKLKKEQREEVVKRDYCIDAFNTNERDTGMKERDRDDLIAVIDDLKMTIQTLDKEIEILKAEIAELQVQLKRAGENREKENAEFEVTVSDQRATQKLLKVSLKILADFYNTFLQESKAEQKVHAGQAPPPGFKSYEKSASSGGVMGMMQGIIDDAKAMEAECIRAEEKAQKDYDEFVAETNKSIETKSTAITTKTEDMAKAEEDKTQAQKDLDATLTEIEHLINEEADLHQECDFVLKNFDVTQAARSDEIESLKQANQVFSGASFGLFLQKLGE
jgi:chaperonin cofactor prefoldin